MALFAPRLSSLMLTLGSLGCSGDDGPRVGGSTGEPLGSSSTDAEGSTGSTGSSEGTASSASTASEDVTSGSTDTSSEEGSDTSPGETGSESSTTGLVPTCHDEDLPVVVPQVVMDTLLGAGDDVAPSCAVALGGEERVYRFTAPEHGVYRFETADSSLDTTVEVLEGCDGAVISCNADFGGPLSRAEAVLLGGQSALVVVDAVTTRSGEFSLLVSRLDFGGSELCAPQGDALGACGASGPGLVPASGPLACDASGVLYFDVYEIPVVAGECLHASVDNVDPAVGPTGGLAADPVLVIRDVLGHAAVFDDEVPCSDPAYGGFECPQGGAVASIDGVMFVGVAQFGGAGCPSGSPHALRVAVGGVDVDLAGLKTQGDLPLDCG